MTSPLRRAARAAWLALAVASAACSAAVVTVTTTATPARADDVPAPQPCQPASVSQARSFQGGISSPAHEAAIATPSFQMAAGFSLDDAIVEMTCLSASVVPMEGQALEPVTFRVEGNQRTIGMDWKVPDRNWNGHYELRVVVVGRARPTIVHGWTNHHQTLTRDVYLVAPAAPPGDLQTKAEAGKATISWKANAEADVFAYVLERTDSKGKVTLLEGPRQPTGQAAASTGDRVSFTDSPGTGTFEYTVRAVRPGKPGEPVFSPPSESVKVNVAPAQAPTTAAPATTVPPGGAAPAGSGQQSGTALAQAGKVDLSSFGALLDERRKAATPRPPTEPDPGFQQALPFGPEDEPALGDDEGAELGGEAADEGVGQQIVDDDEGDRRRAFASVAGALLMFALFLHVRWIKNEVDRVPDLEAEEPGDTGDAALAPIESDAPELDVLDVLDVPLVPSALGQRPRSPRTRSASARRASRRVPPRPTDDRGQGGAPVRTRRRRAGGSDRRVPVGRP